MAAEGDALTIEESFREVFANEPQIVKKTRRKKGAKAARKQKIAIALSKAGASKPKSKRKRRFSARTKF